MKIAIIVCTYKINLHKWPRESTRFTRHFVTYLRALSCVDALDCKPSSYMTTNKKVKQLDSPKDSSYFLMFG